MEALGSEVMGRVSTESVRIALRTFALKWVVFSWQGDYAFLVILSGIPSVAGPGLGRDSGRERRHARRRDSAVGDRLPTAIAVGGSTFDTSTQPQELHSESVTAFNQRGASRHCGPSGGFG